MKFMAPCGFENASLCQTTVLTIFGAKCRTSLVTGQLAERGGGGIAMALLSSGKKNFSAQVQQAAVPAEQTDRPHSPGSNDDPRTLPPEPMALKTAFCVGFTRCAPGGGGYF